MSSYTHPRWLLYCLLITARLPKSTTALPVTLNVGGDSTHSTTVLKVPFTASPGLVCYLPRRQSHALL